MYNFSMDKSQLLLIGILPLIAFETNTQLMLFYVASNVVFTTNNIFLISGNIVLFLAYSSTNTVLTSHFIILTAYNFALNKIIVFLLTTNKNKQTNETDIKTKHCCITTDEKNTILSTNDHALDFFKMTEKEIQKLKISELPTTNNFKNFKFQLGEKMYHLFDQKTENEFQSKEKYFTMVVHDLKQPLHNIFLIMERLQAKDLMKIERSEYNKIILENCKIMKSLISNVLFSSKIHSSDFKLEKREFKLKNLLERTILMSGLSAIMNGIDIALQIPYNLPDTVFGDDNRFQQVIQNLVGNAIKYTKIGSVVVIVDLLSSEYDSIIALKIKVIDTGIGIEEKNKNKLFSEFYQVDGENKEIFQSTGLGLAICKKLIKLMNGDIGLKDGSKKGSEFWFTCEFEKPSDLSRQHSQRKVSTVESVDEYKIDEKSYSSHSNDEVESIFGSLSDDISSELTEDLQEIDSFGYIIGHILVFYRDENVRRVLKFYFKSLNVQATFIQYSDYFSSMDPEKLIKSLPDIVNCFIQFVIIDDFYFEINPNEIKISEKKSIKKSGIDVLRQLKKEIFRHNLHINKNGFSLDVLYALFSSKIKPDKLTKEFHFSIPKPVSLFSMAKMAKLLKKIYNEITYGKYHRRRSIQHSEMKPTTIGSINTSSVGSSDYDDYDKIDFKINSIKRKSRVDISFQRRRSSVDSGKLKRNISDNFDRKKIFDSLTESSSSTSTMTPGTPIMNENLRANSLQTKSPRLDNKTDEEPQQSQHRNNTISVSNFTLNNYQFPLDEEGEISEETSENEKMFSCLIVDDHPMSQKMMIRSIQKLASINVKGAKNGKEAFEIFKESHQVEDKIDLMITDINMDQMNGIECTKKIREYERIYSLQPIFIIGVTGDDDGILKNCLDAGMNKLLFKPFEKEDLENLKEIIEKQKKIK